ncbi:MAG: TatD family hydrolase [Chromatiales bacterium]|jgi:TatD DNase family protein|nr:TatD family hydrolase [Chromatiales bacterium]
MLIDSHCHLDLLDLAALGADFDAVMAEAHSRDVAHMLCVSITLEQFPDMLALVKRVEGVYASVGVHPNERSGRDPSTEELIALARGSERIVAIGETGLDYFRSSGDMGWQQERFRRHIAAARSAGLPLIVHMRDATEDTLRILREERAEEAGGVLHCFTGDLATAEAAMELGFYISFSGIVTFSSARTLQEVARIIPEDRILMETDSPYLAPVPYRGKTNQPAYVRHVAEFIAKLRGVSYEHLAAVTTANFFKLFARAAR